MDPDHMWDLAGWTQIDCAASDEVRATNRGVRSSLTDLDGDFGPPAICIEWAGSGGEPILRDYSDPAHVEPCRHYVLEGGDR